MADEEHSRLSDKNFTDAENEKLWQQLKVDFRLESFKFPDNKIYGIVDVIPESSRKLIKNFILVVNNSNQIEFDVHYDHVSASGFNINRKNPSAYIKAIPKNEKWVKEPKVSKICSFYFTGEVFALSPTISFDWSDEKVNSKPKLVINWYHIGDKNAHKYILYLDDVAIQYIRQKVIDDAFHVSIRSFECGKKHTFQLAARLNNGKETYRSDLIEFTVPNKKPTDNEIVEFIAVSNDRPPNNLPVVILIDEDKKKENPNHNKIEDDLKQNDNKNEEDLKQNHNKLLQRMKKQKNNTQSSSCCCHLPHDTFPGIDHYLNNTNTLSTSQNKSFNKDKRNTSLDESDEETHDDDDDDDVVLPNNKK